jgi:hypothetical protein
MRRTRFFLLTVFLVVFTSGVIHAETLKVLTYNLGLLKVFGSDYVPLVDVRAKTAPAELARFAKEVSPQIMLFEEVWYDSQADAIVTALSPLGYSFAHPNVHSILGLSSGLLLAVKSPLVIVDWKFTPFGRNSFIESFARKGVLEATLESPVGGGIRFVLIGTHTIALDTVNGAAKDKNQAAIHLAHAGQILSIVTARSRGGEVPILLLGDFNVGPGYADASYRTIAGVSGLREAGESLTSTPIITWDPENPLVKFGEYPLEPPAKVDHIFLLDGASLRWNPIDVQRVFDTPADSLSITPAKGPGPIPIPLSDHYGFMADVELSGTR